MYTSLAGDRRIVRAQHIMWHIFSRHIFFRRLLVVSGALIVLGLCPLGLYKKVVHSGVLYEPASICDLPLQY